MKQSAKTNIRTERLWLDEFSPEDAPFMLTFLNDPDFIHYVGDRGVRSLEAAADYIETRFISSYRENGFGLYRVNRQEDQATVGMCGLVDREGLADIDIGFGFLPHYRGQGYALEAALATLEHARRLGIPRIAAIIDPQNSASIVLTKKLGLSFERMIQLGTEDAPVELYATALDRDNAP